MNEHSNATPAMAWLEQHADRLAELAGDHGVDQGLVRLAAILVLGGFTDPEILHELGAHHLSADGQRDPLAGVPPTLEGLRKLVGSSSPEP